MAARLVVFSAALVFLLSGASGAFGYVRSFSPHSGKPFVWTEGCIVVQADARGSQDLDIDTVDATLARSALNWSSRTDGCSNLRLTTIPHTTAVDVAADNRPVVVFRDKVWARPGGIMHDPMAIGLTTVMYVNTPGQTGDATILDADIELNGVNYTFTTDPATATARDGTFAIADLENTLTHELGHVQGLAHTCYDGTTDTRPVDDMGNPIPDCSPDLPPAILNTTMYPYSYTEGETSKRMLSDDEVRAICGIYPNTDPPKACYSLLVGGSSCAQVPPRPESGPGAPLAVLVLAAGALVARGRRRRA